MVNKIFYTA
jgi:hypothetical protein